MKKGENIFKRKDGLWEARYIKGYELSGKIKYGFCYGKTYKEAKEKVSKHKAALLAGKPTPQTGTRHRFAFYCDEWLRLRKSTIRESTYIKYDTVLEKHIKPKLGGCFPMGITTGVVDDFTHELLFEDELAVKTAHDILVVLHGVLKHTAAQLPGIFPAVEINYPKESRRETRVLSRDEQTQLVRYLLTDTDACKFGVLLMLLSGVRIGELCALKWGNIDLKEQTIRIIATLQRLHDTAMESETRTRVVIGAPKSDTSVRTIPLTDYAATLCSNLLCAMQPPIFLPVRRTIWSLALCNTALKSIQKNAGLRAYMLTRSGTLSPPEPWRSGLKSNRCPKCWDTPIQPLPWSDMFTPLWS